MCLPLSTDSLAPGFPIAGVNPDKQVLHHLANRVLTRLSNWIAGLRLTDMETGYKVFRREVLTGLDFQPDRFGIEPELTAKIAVRGWRILEVPVSYCPREEDRLAGWRLCAVLHLPVFEGFGSKRRKLVAIGMTCRAVAVARCPIGSQRMSTGRGCQSDLRIEPREVRNLSPREMQFRMEELQ